MKYSILCQRWLGPILVLILCAPQTAEACSCAAYPDDIEKAVTMAYAQGNGMFQVDAIFLGDVTTMRKRNNWTVPYYEVTFSVRDRWKGSIPGIVSVRTNGGEIACGYEFEKGNSYLIFARWDERLQQLATSFCDLTRHEAKAKDAIKVLDRLANKQRTLPSKSNR